MRSSVLRALLLDALHQVLDNWIFRVLVIVVGLIILPTFLVGFREESILLLYGWEEISYERLFRFFGGSTEGVEDIQARTIQTIQTLVVEYLCGYVGILCCVSATAFFVPQMLERGSADVVFARPLSRTRLLLTRYFSGLVFVGLLAGLLVTGMYLGFLLVSGYGDVGFLWGAVTLVYLFAIVHGVAVLAGVVTRSTVAAILISLVFFVGTGCVHRFWVLRTYLSEGEVISQLRVQSRPGAEEEAPIPEVLDQERVGTLGRILVGILDTLHWTLPKTRDADVITRRLRKALEGGDRPLSDPVIFLEIPRAPEGFDLVDRDGLRAVGGGVPVDLAARPLAWSATDGSARITLSRTSREAVAPRPEAEAGRRGSRRVTTTSAAKDLMAAITAGGRASSPPEQTSGLVDGGFALFVGWRETVEGRDRQREVAFFTVGDWLVRAELDAGGDRSREFREFTASFRLARPGELEDPDAWFERRAGWTAEARFNLLLSVGSSLLFLLLALLAAAWKLSRIDF